MDVRETAHVRMVAALAELEADPLLLPDTLSDALDQHHRIAKSEKNRVYLSELLRKHAGDPAYKVRRS